MSTTIINGVTVKVFADGSVLMSEGDRTGTLDNEERTELIYALVDVPTTDEFDEFDEPDPDDPAVSVEVLAYPTLFLEPIGSAIVLSTREGEGDTTTDERPWEISLSTDEARELRDALDYQIMTVEVGQ
jgi:hypothetical protein